ncbi:hypothetical protein M0R45_008170 [Rubus argutus]|uniref:Uncharacterized protein n=1 Tax=Rubus argutus TaxID=59490 RepID=A0AAW1Y3P2_RUBAR
MASFNHHSPRPHLTKSQPVPLSIQCRRRCHHLIPSLYRNQHPCSTKEKKNITAGAASKLPSPPLQPNRRCCPCTAPSIQFKATPQARGQRISATASLPRAQATITNHRRCCHSLEAVLPVLCAAPPQAVIPATGQATLPHHHSLACSSSPGP